MEGKPPAAPATEADLRVLRRWVLVAGVWAVAATAVGLIALLDTSGDDASKRAGGAEERIDRIQRSVDARIEDLETRLGDVPRSGDVSKLQDRLAKAEEEAATASRNAKDADEQVADLEERVKTLEESPPARTDESSPP
jgi:chromosome segregation ATPase